MFARVYTHTHVVNGMNKVKIRWHNMVVDTGLAELLNGYVITGPVGL